MINQNIRKIPSNNDLNSNTEINEIGSNHANQQTSGNRIHFKPEINEEIFNETLKEIIEKRNQVGYFSLHIKQGNNVLVGKGRGKESDVLIVMK